MRKVKSQVQVRNCQREPVDIDFLRKAALCTLKRELIKANKQISMALVDNEKIVELNRKFRGMDKVTDVLAFPLGGEFVSTESLLGEVIISVEAAEEEAKERGHSLREELALLAIHGVLHLLGYLDKEEAERVIMQNKEKSILKSLGMRENLV
ncbi:MAG: rRNA maturation RNase YbeY [Candidatus Aerophobetes bacterium]|nr:rRNA maturation RNase YbeY [Candidatus Aerophobetes bacterium]